MAENEILLRLKGVGKRFRLGAGIFSSEQRSVHALNQVSLTILKGETYGLVGESGSGKSTLAKCLVNVYPFDEGEAIFYDSQDFVLNQKTWKQFPFLRQKIKYVFQDPAASLDPRLTIEEILTIGVRNAKLLKADEARNRGVELLEAVGLNSDAFKRRPADFSGGQRQRISLARALMSRPKLLICDEVVSALDVSVQGQILNLLVKLKQEYGFSMLFIAHDLGVVSYMSDRVGVMYGGQLLEQSSAKELFQNPRHPYSQLLLSSMPQANGEFLSQKAMGEPFDPLNPPLGCPFAPRCPLVHEDCQKKESLTPVEEAGSFCRCIKNGYLSK